MKQRNPLLSAAMERILTWMRDSPDEELTRDGRAWWFGDDQVNGSECKRLIQHCLIKIGYDGGRGYETYEITDDGRKILENPSYIPRILRSQKERDAEIEAWTRGTK